MTYLMNIESKQTDISELNNELVVKKVWGATTIEAGLNHKKKDGKNSFG